MLTMGKARTIQDRRKALGWSVAFVADQLDCPPSTVYRIEARAKVERNTALLSSYMRLLAGEESNRRLQGRL